MYFIKMEVTTADTLYNFGLKNPKVVPFIGEALCNAVLICSANRAGSKTTLNKEMYLKALLQRLRTNSDNDTSDTFLSLVRELFIEIDAKLEEEIIKHECRPMEYKLFKKERSSIFITRVK